MPIIPRVGRRNPKIMLAIFTMYALLCIGGTAMVYPFLITLTGAVSNAYEYEEHNVLPYYVWDQQECFLKYVVEKYYERPFQLFRSCYAFPGPMNDFRDVHRKRHLVHDYFPAFGTNATRAPQLRAILADYQRFMASQPDQNVLPAFNRFAAATYRDFLQRRYRRLVREQQPDTAAAAGSRELDRLALGLLADNWAQGRFDMFEAIQYDTECNYPYHNQKWFPPDNPRQADYLDFLRELPPLEKIPISGQYLWLRFLEHRGTNLEQLNGDLGTDYKTLEQMPMPAGWPTQPALRKLYNDFLQTRWPLRLVELPADAQGPWRRYLQRRVRTVERYNKLCQTSYKTLDDVPFCRTYPRRPLERNLWREFVLGDVPRTPEMLRYPERAYRDLLRRRYGTIDRLNAAYGWSCRSFDEIRLPIGQVDYRHFTDHQGTYRTRFLTFNFAQCIDFMAVHGRALWNTAILVALTLLATLTVNPLAAYALSRFEFRWTYQVLVFLLATMAFPAEVVMIPNFLLLRDLGMLNTFFALVLPGLANGFSIFLLKGFFDSLPRELYEAASIDGAPEHVMFLRITLPLTKPILAVIALNAFIAAYGNFMYALLVCQDERMWTLMVWIYQFQSLHAGEPYMSMAGFVLASIPTLLVFVFCQNIILRGIIIPQMK